jgi:NADH dehydrogenase
MTEQPNRICILGGGFGGLYTALRLSQLPWVKQEKPEMVLVDRCDRFLFSPLLYELMTGELQTWEIAPLFQDLLAGTGIQFYQAAVAGIDLQAKRVQFHDGPEMSYSHLVLAMGGETPLNQVPGVEEYALPFRTVANAHQLEERLRSLETTDTEKIRVAIVGGGYSGVELACKLAERLQDRGRIRLIEQTDQILRPSSEFNRDAAMKALSDRGVWLDLTTTVAEVTSNSISLTYKDTTDTIPVDIVLWTVGTRVTEVINHLPLKKNQRGQLTVTPTLQIPDYPEVFALGDLVDGKDATEQLVPATAQAAIQQADYVGWNLWASLTGRPLLSFRYQSLGEMMTLGIDNATMTGLGLKLDGPLAAIARRLAYLYRMPTLDHQIRVGLSWISQPIVSILENLAKQ